jgi:hypothetical protein
MALAALSVNISVPATAYADDRMRTTQNESRGQEYSSKDAWRASRQNDGQVIFHYGQGMEDIVTMAVEILKEEGYEKVRAMNGLDEPTAHIWVNGSRLKRDYTKRDFYDGTALGHAALSYEDRIAEER